MRVKLPLIAESVAAEENLLIDCQFLIQWLMDRQEITPAELAARTGYQPWYISNMLSAEGALGVRALARILHAMGKRATITLVEPDGSEQPVAERKCAFCSGGKRNETTPQPDEPASPAEPVSPEVPAPPKGHFRVYTVDGHHVLGFEHNKVMYAVRVLGPVGSRISP